MLEELLHTRKVLIEMFTESIKSIEDKLPKRFLRGPIQRTLLELHKLPKTGNNTRAINEAFELLGYKKVFIDGWRYYKRIKE